METPPSTVSPCAPLSRRLPAGPAVAEADLRVGRLQLQQRGPPRGEGPRQAGQPGGGNGVAGVQHQPGRQQVGPRPALGPAYIWLCVTVEHLHSGCLADAFIQSVLQ